jgi:glutathione synthase/RimK-type ligase-like ATP-grasp enzyme
MHVALVTHAGLPELAEDERPMRAALEGLGIRASPAVWNDAGVDWAEFDAAILRSTWDYHLRREEFLAWIDRADHATHLWNPAPLLRWNSHKAYLRDLESSGIPIVPTAWSDGTRTLGQLMEEHDWEDAVFKPAVSAAAHRTYRVTPSTLPTAEPVYRALCQEQLVLVQPYLRSVEQHGEHSLIYLDGRFSHAVDRPAVLAPVSDFPGGQPVVAAADERRLGQEVLAAARIPTLYARVDVARDATGRLCLTELEVIEPSLFLGSAPGAVPRFAQAIQARLGP